MSDSIRPGHAVGLLDGETEVWPTLATATIGTTVSDVDGREWVRYDKWWSGPEGARLTSAQLGSRGPLVVRSVHECEEFADLTSFASRYVTSMCVSCGASKETLR